MLLLKYNLRHFDYGPKWCGPKWLTSVLVSSRQKINKSETGIQNHLDLEVRMVLDTCFTFIDFLKTWNQQLMCNCSMGRNGNGPK